MVAASLRVGLTGLTGERSREEYTGYWIASALLPFAGYRHWIVSLKWTRCALTQIWLFQPQMDFSVLSPPVWRISVYNRIIQRQKILIVANLVFINQEISLSLKKRGGQNRGQKVYPPCGLWIIKVPHSDDCPTGVQAEAEQSSGTVHLHGNAAGVQ